MKTSQVFKLKGGIGNQLFIYFAALTSQVQSGHFVTFEVSALNSAKTKRANAIFIDDGEWEDWVAAIIMSAVGVYFIVHGAILISALPDSALQKELDDNMGRHDRNMRTVKYQNEIIHHFRTVMVVLGPLVLIAALTPMAARMVRSYLYWRRYDAIYVPRQYPQFHG